MPKLGMQTIRQQQIIEAAIKTIHALGIEQSSIRQIGSRAGVSPSLITHYFGNRDELYTMVLRHLNRELAQATARNLRQATLPIDRLMAVAAAQFDPKQFQPAIASTWFALWAALRSNKDMMRYQSIYQRRLASNLTHCLRDLVPAERVDFCVNALSAMIDGLWVRAAQPVGHISSENALKIFEEYVLQLVGQLRQPETKQWN